MTLPQDRPSTRRVCNFRASSGAGTRIAERCDAEAARLRRLEPAAGLEALRDSRPLHARLFGGLAPAEFADAAGTYRGTRGSSLEDAPRAVFHARRVPGLRTRDTCLPAAEVPAAMDDLADRLTRLWHDRPGAADPFRDASFAAMADVTARFFAVHPYMDGNGHVWRLALPVLGARLGLSMRAEWTVDLRPYGSDLAVALQWYGDHPTILSDLLRRWMPVGA